MGREFTSALQGLGETFASIDKSRRQKILDELEAEKNKQTAKYNEQLIEKSKMDVEKEKLNNQIATRKELENQKLQPEVLKTLGEYSILRGLPTGEGRYQQTADTLKPTLDLGAVSQPDTFELSPDLTKMRTEDLRKSQLASLSPRQLGATQGWNVSDLPSAKVAQGQLDEFQKAEDQAMKDKQAQLNADRTYQIEQRKLEALEAKTERDQGVEQSNKNRTFIREIQKDYTTAVPYKSMTETTNFAKGVISSLASDNATGDLLAIKALEKTLQPESSVMQGESDAYQNAGTIFDRIVNDGFYAMLAKGQGRLPPTIRKQMEDLSKNLYTNRREEFNNFRKGQMNTALKEYSLPEESVDRIFHDIPMISLEKKKQLQGNISDDDIISRNRKPQ